MPKSIILASGSAARRQMFADAGVDVAIEKPRVDEESIKASLDAEGASPRDIADTLAECKARRVSEKNPDAFVIGCDQVLDFRGNVLSKARSLAEAHAQLSSLRGRSHKLLSAAVIFEGGKPVWRHVGQVHLWMRDFTDDFLASYLDRLGDGVLETVGCYKLEAEGVRLFSRIEGDYFTVLGMPLIQILNYLTERGALQR